MCGIVGIFNLFEPKNVSSDLIKKMNQKIHHRGPDQSGEYFDEYVGLGHRRLSIIDLKNGKQPLFNEDETVAIVYNGEIYNFLELEKELKSHGHIFKTRCDTEVIVHAWEQWGVECVKKFNGMFAFCIWDKAKKQLFLARDQIGIKPLFYCIDKYQRLLFASELKAILVADSFDKELNINAIEDYFSYGYIPDPNTIFKNVFKLPPAHYLLVNFNDNQPIKPTEFWDLSFKPIGTKSENEIGEELIDRLEKSVKSQLVTEVPLGAFLSGGVDSSSVVALMAQNSSEPVNTCSIAFDESDYDESKYAKEVADQFHTNHSTEISTGNDLSIINNLHNLYDEPYADNSAIPTYKLCEITRKKVTVALSGDGGDENFAGYKSYQVLNNLERVRTILPAPIQKNFFGFLGNVYPKADWAPKIFRAKRTFEKLAQSTVDGFALGSMITSPSERKNFFSDSFNTKLNGYTGIEVFRNYSKKSPTNDPLSICQYIDFKVYLPADVLTKVDRASMAHSLEVRVPLLDHTFVDWVSGIPSNLKLKNGISKYIFKKSLEKKLSNNILYRKKMGFSTPITDWTRGILNEQIKNSISNQKLLDLNIFNSKMLDKIYYEHQKKIRNHSNFLWALFQFERFCNSTF